MSWSKEKTTDRIKNRDFKSSEVTLSKLSRERDFENIGPKEAVEAQSVHYYSDYAGFREAVEEAAESQEKQKKIVRALNVLTKMSDLIVSKGDHTQTLQVQSSRTHSMTFKPYDDEKQRTINAVLQAFDFLSFAPIFNSVFESELGQALYGQVGMDAGRTFIVNVGKKGCRELLSLGGPASIAAKNIGDSDSVVISDQMRKSLPSNLQKLFVEEKKGGRTVFVARSFRWANHEALLKELGHEFDEAFFLKKTNDYKSEYNLAEIDISRATEKIDFERLSSRIVKRQDSVSVYADLDGFTAFMDSLKTDEDVREMVRLFSGIRTEFEEVLTSDFDEGLKIQQRGDCILANFHVPATADQEVKRTKTAVKAAIGLMSSIDVLKDYFKPTLNLQLQIGESSGKLFFSRVGKNGQKTPVVVGHAEDRSESLQREALPGEIRICVKTYERLPEGVLKNAFFKLENQDVYAAKGLTFDKLISLEDKELEKAAFEKRGMSETVRPGLLQVGAASSKSGWSHVNSTPHFTK